jgi:hypothetical protein
VKGVRKVDLSVRNLAIALTFVLCLSALSGVSRAASEPVSIVWITDTQYLADRFPNNFDAMCNWIVENSEEYNIKMVVHTGDIVEHASNLTEWDRVNHSLGILLDNGIPYCWNAGNHDQLGGTWYGKNYVALDSTLLREKPYWCSDSLEGKNTAVFFEVADWTFLVINMEFNANESVLRWARNLLSLYPDSHALIAMHSFMNETCAYDDWAIKVRDTVVASNPNVFLTLNGHFMENSRTSRTFVDGVHELFFNYQHTKGGLGDSAVRILTFDREGGIIRVSTFNPVTGESLADPDNQFVLDIPFDDLTPDLSIYDAPSSSLPDAAASESSPVENLTEIPSTTVTLLNQSDNKLSESGVEGVTAPESRADPLASPIAELAVSCAILVVLTFVVVKRGKRDFRVVKYL